jgi:hypothetical protein
MGDTASDPCLTARSCSHETFFEKKLAPDLQESPNLSQAFKRVLVIAPFPPEGGGGGGVHMRNLLADYPVEKLSWFTLSPDKTQTTEWWKPGMARGSFRWRIPGRRFPAIRWLAARGFDQTEACLAGSAAGRYARKTSPSLCWLVASQLSMRALERVRSNLPCGFHLSVHDDPAISAQLGGTRFTPYDQRCFESLVINARSMDCISERMRTMYATRYGRESIVVTRGFDEPVLNADGDAPINEHAEIGIVLAGWGDCPAPWPGDFLAAIRSGRKLRNYQVYALDPRVPEEPHVHRMPRLSEAEFDTFMRSKTIGYACDPITPTGRKFAATSFSTKVVTYIGYGLPFVYHGPEDSTVGDLVKNYKCGVIVESHDPDRILQAFESLVRNYQSYRMQCIAARKDLFDAAVIRKRLFQHMSLSA